MWHGVINQHSGKRIDLPANLLRQLEQHPTIEWHKTPSEAALNKVLANLAQTGEQYFMVAGGDGTLHRALNTLRPTAERPLCIAPLPKGSGNDWCRSLGCPTRFDAALEAALNNPTRGVDYFKVTADSYTALGLNSVGCGFDTQVLNYLEQHPHRRLKYWRALLEMLSQRKPVTLTVCNQPTERILLLLGKGRYAGSGMCLLPTSRLDNGLLTITEVAPLSNGELYRELPRLKTGGFISNPHVLHYQQPTASFEFAEPTAIQIDGELYPPTTRIKVEVVEHALRVPNYQC